MLLSDALSGGAAVTQERAFHSCESQFGHSTSYVAYSLREPNLYNTSGA